MHVLYFFLYLFAGVSFGLAAGGVSIRKIDLLALGLLLWVTVEAIQSFQKL